MTGRGRDIIDSGCIILSVGSRHRLTRLDATRTFDGSAGADRGRTSADGGASSPKAISEVEMVGIWQELLLSIVVRARTLQLPEQKPKRVKQKAVLVLMIVVQGEETRL